MSITVAVDGIKIANKPTLKLADYPGLFRWAQGDQKVIKAEEMQRRRARKGDVTVEARSE